MEAYNDESTFLWEDIPIDMEQYSNLYTTLTGIFSRSISKFDFKHHEHSAIQEYSKIEGVTRALFALTNQGLQFYVFKELARKSEFLLPLNCMHYNGSGNHLGAYAIRLRRNEKGGKWERVFSPYCSSSLPKPSDTIYRLGQWCWGIFIVPIEWVWSRDDLAGRGSEVIYLSVSAQNNIVAKGS